jgi:hypothetical protein
VNPCPRVGCGLTVPHSHLPALPPEVQRARLEDPEFATVLGRFRTKLRGTEYRPERDYPWRPAGKSVDRVDAVQAEKVEELIDKWRTRGNPYRRKLRSI